MICFRVDWLVVIFSIDDFDSCGFGLLVLVGLVGGSTLLWLGRWVTVFTFVGVLALILCFNVSLCFGFLCLLFGFWELWLFRYFVIWGFMFVYWTLLY